MSSAPIRIPKTEAESQASTSNVKLVQHVGPLSDFSTAVLFLLNMSPERLSLAQALFFILAATADANGRPATLTQLKEMGGKRLERSVHNTYKVWLEPNRQYPEAVGLLTREVNPADEREHILKLTSRGREVAEQLAILVKGE